MNDVIHIVWASLVALPWLLVLGFTLVNIRNLSCITGGLLFFGTILQLLSHVTGIIRYHILEHGNAAPTMIHALIRAESIIWILGGLLFATGFGKLIKERNTAQQTPPGDSLKALPEE